MINVIKYVLEGLAVALVTNIISHGKISLGELLLISLTTVAVFILLDMFAPLRSVLVQSAGAGSEPDMCGGSLVESTGGGLLQALQTAGAPTQAAPEKLAVQIPYKMERTDYGAGVLSAGFNENADGYNADKLQMLAPF